MKRFVLLGGLLLLATASHGKPPLPVPAEDEFHFVVIGDSQFDDPVAANRLYDDLRWLLPAFVIQVGDMIHGYAQASTLRAEWRRFRAQLAPLRRAGIPFLPVAGNHDVFNEKKRPGRESLAVYEDEWGKAYYQFRYRNTQFFILNSDPVGAANDLDPAQLKWLINGLSAAADAAHRLVFLHRPPQRLGNADRFHQLMVEHGVSHVFYGHHHHYHQRHADGVTYVMTNGSGDSPITIDRTGSFDHVLQVSVRDDRIDYAILRADAIEAPGFAVADDNYDLFKLRRGLEDLSPLLKADARTAGADGQRYQTRLALSNPSQRTVTFHLHCRSDDDRFRFEPGKLAPMTLKPRSTRTLPLTVIETAPSEAKPVCSVQFPFQTHDGGWHLPEVEIILRKP